MATQRQLILDDIATTLAAIDVDAGFHTTVKTVERGYKDAAEVSTSDRPWLGFAPPADEPDTIEHLPFNAILRVTMPIKLFAHVAPTSAEDKAAALSDLMDDVIRALMTDPTRGGNAMLTTIGGTGGGTDEGQGNVSDSRGGTGTFVLPFSVTYYREV